MKKENMVSGSHIAYLRDKRGLTQPQLAAVVSEMIKRPIPYSTTIVSAWESGKRTPSQEAAEAMSDLFNASVEYILGKTNIMDEDSKDMNIAALNQAVLTYEKLSQYHGLPVYITFPSMEHNDCWGICDCTSNKAINIITIHGIIEITKKNIGEYKIFSRETDSANVESLKKRNNLGITQIINSSKPVYVQMLTADTEVHAGYDGWYRVTKDNQFLQNASGKVLPIAGLHTSFNCYSDIL